MNRMRYETRRSAKAVGVVLHGVELTRRGEVWRGMVKGLEVRAWQSGIGHANRTGWRCTVGTEHPVTGIGEGESLEVAFRVGARDLERILDELRWTAARAGVA